MLLISYREQWLWYQHLPWRGRGAHNLCSGVSPQDLCTSPESNTTRQTPDEQLQPTQPTVLILTNNGVKTTMRFQWHFVACVSVEQLSLS